MGFQSLERQFTAKMRSNQLLKRVFSPLPCALGIYAKWPENLVGHQKVVRLWVKRKKVLLL